MNQKVFLFFLHVFTLVLLVLNISVIDDLTKQLETCQKELNK